jgi:colanic acid biosynthesis glycosyl transferase WcaI
MGAVAYSAARKLLYREPTWLNIQDIPADAAAASGISRNRFTKGLGQLAQSLLFNRADVWSTIAPKMVERVAALRRRNQPVHFVPNFLNRSMEQAVAEHPSKLGRPVGSPLKLLYAGNIGKKQGLLEFCQRLSQSKLDFRFNIHGDGGEAHAVRDWVAAQRDPRFAFGAFLDERGFVAALVNTDFFVITEKPGVGASFIPSKLIPCIATGTPVVCVCDAAGPLGQEVNRYDLGITVEWSQYDQLLPRLAEAAGDPSRFAALQRHALDRAQTYGRTPIIELVERELKRMALSSKHAQSDAGCP